MSPKESTTERSRMTLSELRIELKTKRAEAAGLRIGLVMQKEKNSAHYKNLRREIAQLCFFIGSKEKTEGVGKKKESADAEKMDDKKMMKVSKSATPKKSASQKAKKSVKHSSSKLS